jgi:phage tail-like protein
MVMKTMRQGAFRVAAMLGNEFIVSRFSVELQGMLTATFKDCSGLSGEVELESYSEGGLNNYEHKLPGRTKWGNVKLSSGVASAVEIWDWFNDVSMGTIERKNVSIIMHWPGGLEAARWNLEAAYPVRWEGPSYAAGETNVTLHSLELAHHGITMGV